MEQVSSGSELPEVGREVLDACPPVEHHHRIEQLSRMNDGLSEVLTAAKRAERSMAAHSGQLVPAWRQVTEAEQRLPVTLAVVIIIVLQARVPEHLALFRWWILPIIEAVLLTILIASNPRRVDQSNRRLRALSLLLIALASLANGWAATSLIVGLVNGTQGKTAASLLLTGSNIWLTNVVVFALWYWDLDRGGPGARACAAKAAPDFLFPQMNMPAMVDSNWEPYFADYLYLAFTNATAFSPTDTMPLSRWSKMAMMLQSAIALVTGALIVARAVNILQ